MRYSGLAKEVRKRWGSGKTTEPHDAAQDVKPERTVADNPADAALDWNEDAQDQISALLDEVSEEPEEETLDLEAIREALAARDAAASSAPTVESDEDEEDELYLIIDEILSPEPETRETFVSEADQPGDPGPVAPAVEKAETPLTPMAIVLEPVFKDMIMTELLGQEIVTLSQTLTAVRRQAEQPDKALWRILAALPNVDRALVFEQAAHLQGFKTIDVAEAFAPDAVGAIMQQVSPALRKKLADGNLLPLCVEGDAGEPHLLVATHDPTNPTLRPIFDGFGASVRVFHAPEEVVAGYLEAILTGRPIPGVSVEETDQDEDAGLIDDAANEEFLELQWEPFEDEALEEITAPEDTEALDIAWKPLAELIAEEEEGDEGEGAEESMTAVFDFTPEERAGLTETDRRADDEITLDDVIPDLLESFHDDAHTNGNGTGHNNGEIRSEDYSIDLGEMMASPQASDAEKAPAGAAQSGASIEPSRPVEKPRAVEPVEEALSEAELNKIRAKDRVVAMLLRKKIIGTRAIKQAQQKQKADQIKEPLWRILTTVDGIDRAAIFEEAASVYAFKPAAMGDAKPDPEFARSVMNTFDEQLRDSLLKLRVVPLEVDLDPQTGAIKVVFVTHDPTRPDVHRVMQKLKLERFELRYAPENVVMALILDAFPRKNEFLERLDEHSAFDLGTSYEESGGLIDEEALEAEINRSKLINLFEATLVEAVRQDVSDIHIWPNARKQVEIHFRIDGRLRRWHVEDKIHPEALIAVIKDNSMNVDRFERDAAQDGFIQRWIDEALIRFRVSVLPIATVAQEVRGESIVIRVLDDRKVVKDLAKLGLNRLALDRFRKAISQPHGMVILTGPTGSGKTTTLYASLHEVISPEVNVLTVEDPVEYILPGVRQIKLNSKLGLDGALRSILRHDPDVVMVGEMRDRATAELAIKLANTGHLTFSTLHTNDAASAVTRLYKMGIEPFLIAYAINLVVAQRLIRRLCPTCKKPDPDPDHVLMRKLGFNKEQIKKTTVFIEGHDDACPMCHGLGYKGRRAVSEALYFSREIRHFIADSDGKLDEIEIKDMAAGQGMMTLVDSAREVVMDGDTSILEMMRVVSTEE